MGKHSMKMVIVKGPALDDGNKDKLDSTLSLLNEIQSGAHASQPPEVLDDESLEKAAEKVHEEWRQKKHSEMLALGVTLPVPQWKRLPDEEYKEWSAALSEDVLAKVHCYCPPQPTNASFPHLNMRGEGMKVSLAFAWVKQDGLRIFCSFFGRGTMQCIGAILTSRTSICQSLGRQPIGSMRSEHLDIHLLPQHRRVELTSNCFQDSKGTSWPKADRQLLQRDYGK